MTSTMTNDTLLPAQVEMGLPECQFSAAPVAYEEAVDFMENRVQMIRAGTAGELLWFLEHPPLYTAGTSADKTDLLDADRFPVFKTGRGGAYTYHGPGQRIVYMMLDLKKRGTDIRRFVRNVEKWMILACAEFNIQAHIREGEIGVWVPRPELGAEREDKIGAIGIRIRRWVSFHGLALNVEPDLSHFSGIVPCGIRNQGVTSMINLGYPITLEDVDAALLKKFPIAFDFTQTQS